MFGLVKESRLTEANEEISKIKKELSEVTEALAEQSKIINSPEFVRAKKLIDLKADVEILEKKRDAISKECRDERTKIEAKSSEKLQEAEKKFSEVIEQANIEACLIKERAVASSDKELSEIQEKINERSQYYESLEVKIVKLQAEIKELDLDLENHDLLSTITPYEHLINGPVSETIKTSLETVKEKQKQLIKQGGAFEIRQEIYWNDSLAKGKARQKRHGKFLVTAFNAEVDNIVTNTNARNFATNAKKIESWFSKVNKSGDDSYVELSRKLLFLRLEEHRHAFEYRIKKEMEIEEQRYIRESIREEAKVKKEIESFITTCEKEEKAYQTDLNKSIAMIESANKEEVEKLNAHIAELRQKLERATSEKERAMSMAQLTRSGYVYIISNKGSFGENVYKIGMTRRLEPMDRVKELGDASVPFYFDVHALIPSDDAPTLENKLHKRFEAQRVNKVNHRREYFNVTIEEIEQALNEFVDNEFNLVCDALAEQYEESKRSAQMVVSNG